MGLVCAEHVQRGRLALIERDVPVLDPHPPAAVDHALVLGDVAGRVDPGRRGPQPGVDRDAAAGAELEPGGAREHHVGHRARAHDHRVGFELGGPCLVIDLGDAAVGALEAVELVVAVDGDPVLLEAVLEEASGALAEPAAERRPRSSITIEQVLPSSVSDAATSLAM